MSQSPSSLSPATASSSGVNSPLDQPPLPPRVRKSYSRNGCRECKRRKIRCPEEKPYCSTCVRLGKQCSYPLAGEKVLRISRRLIKEEIENMGKSTQFYQYNMIYQEESNHKLNQ